MKMGDRSWRLPTATCYLLVILSVILLPSPGSALSINRREPVTEQVLIITTPQSQTPTETETPSYLQDDNEEMGGIGASTPSLPMALILESEQSDMPVDDGGIGGNGGDASTTVDTIIVQDTTGESYDVVPTASNIISKDVEIEIATSENTNRLNTSAGESVDNSDSSKPILPEIYSFHVESNIQYRYSRTYITSRVANKDLKRAQEVTFSVVLPETAFISKFIMEIDGKPYEAYVKEKEEAKKDYAHAQSQGQSAGLVEKSTRNSNVFNVNVNIKPQTKVTFNLTYEELLTRRLGRYEQAININPDQVSSIKDYQITVNIEESRNLTLVRVPSLSNEIDAQDPDGNNPDAVIERPAPNKAKISWKPTPSDQKKLKKSGISGKFVVQYDVDRIADGGQVLVMQGYFVHFFAPENLPPLRKHVVFILDISGSMWGRKMDQLKESQTKILNDLSPDDFFNIITFSSDVYLWSPNDVLNKKDQFRQSSFPTMKEITPPELLARKTPLPATKQNVDKAKAFIQSLVASGGTNIHDAIIEALNLTAAIKDAQKQNGGGASGTEPTESIGIETTILPIPSSSSVGTPSTTTTTTTLVSSTTSKKSTTTSSTTTAGVTEEDDENRPVEIVDIGRSSVEVTDKPEDSTTLTPSSSQNGNILPPNVQSLIIFLTDGEPTVGITDPPEIQKLIRAANQYLSIPIFSLGFGEGADFPFLKKLSLQNNGFGRKIYEASDAALQLKGFYNEIASPLLANVKFNYTSEDYNVTDLTVTRFPTVFGGTEIAVAGKLVAPPKPERIDEETTLSASQDDLQPSTQASYTDETPSLDAGPFDPNRLSIACDFESSDRNYFDVNVEGIGRDGEIELSHVEVYERPPRCGFGIDLPFFYPPAGSVYPPRPTPPPTPEDTFLERLWAYLTIQQLIEKDLAGLEDPSSGDAKPSDTDTEDAITPTSTQSPDDSSQVTMVLPNQGSTTPSPSVRRNSTKPETSKERALRLALKYGFVTPLTSLVVVKPNSSDVTNAVPTDGRPDALDSLFARKISFQAPILNLITASKNFRPAPASGPTQARYGGAPPPRTYQTHYSSYDLSASSEALPAPTYRRRGGPSPIKTLSSNVDYSTESFPAITFRSTAHRRPQPISRRGWKIITGSGGMTRKQKSLWERQQAARNSNGGAPQSIALALAAPAYQHQTGGIRNKIAYSPIPISANYQYLSRPIPPIPLVGGHHQQHAPPPALGFGGPSGFGGSGPAGFGVPPPLSIDYDMPDSSSESLNLAPSPVQPIPGVVGTQVSTTARAPTTTTPSPTGMELSDITWLSPNQRQLDINGTIYKIAKKDKTKDNEGYQCSSTGTPDAGECRHLQSCVLPLFSNDKEAYKGTYFCSIQSSKPSRELYAGVCCPSIYSKKISSNDEP